MTDSTTIKETLDRLPQVPQRQDSLVDQLADLQKIANRLGMYDAADFVKNTLWRARQEIPAKERTTDESA